jgi:hypothetical protein
MWSLGWFTAQLHPLFLFIHFWQVTSTCATGSYVIHHTNPYDGGRDSLQNAELYNSIVTEFKILLCKHKGICQNFGWTLQQTPWLQC